MINLESLFLFATGAGGGQKKRDLREDAERGAKAEATLRDPLLQETFQELASAYGGAWVNTLASETEKREQLYCLMQALRAVQKHIEQVAAGGRLAARELDEVIAKGKKR